MKASNAPTHRSHEHGAEAAPGPDDYLPLPRRLRGCDQRRFRLAPPCVGGARSNDAPLAPFSALRQALGVPFLPGDVDVESFEDAALSRGEGVESKPV